MKKILFVPAVIISLLYCFPLTLCLALHDDETLKDGGAWRPAEMNVGPDRSGSEEKIDKMLDKSFERSKIVIPPRENNMDKESGPEENLKKTDDSVEKRK